MHRRQWLRLNQEGHEPSALWTAGRDQGGVVGEAGNPRRSWAVGIHTRHSERVCLVEERGTLVSGPGDKDTCLSWLRGQGARP